jgi:hypothetical protein
LNKKSLIIKLGGGEQMGKTHKIGAMITTVMLGMGIAAAPVAAFSLGDVLGGITKGKTGTTRGVNSSYFVGHPRPQKETRWVVYNPNGKFKYWGKVVYPDGSDAANVDIILATTGRENSLENVFAVYSSYETKTDANGRFSISFNGGYTSSVMAWKGNLVGFANDTDSTGRKAILLELHKTSNGKNVGFRHDGDHT